MEESWFDSGGPDYQQTLRQEGVVVIPTPLANKADGTSALRTAVQQDLLQHYRESPEFNEPNPANPAEPLWQPQLAGFAANANPSSFHHPFVRKMREMCAAVVLETDVLPLDGRKLEEPYDRLLYRIAGEKPKAESMHRDEAKTASDGDVIFGGWINLEDVPQVFSCCPQTHTEVGGQNRGFAEITSDEEKARYRPHFREVNIPPGCMVIFYERLVHEVNAKTVPPGRIMIRMFLGWRVTDGDQPLFGNAETSEWIQNQAVPKIKSDQWPLTWPPNYSNFPLMYQKLTDWSKRTFVHQCLYTHIVGGTNPAWFGKPRIQVKAHMLSLREYGFLDHDADDTDSKNEDGTPKLKMHPAYDVHEISLLAPQRAWKLYTFDSTDERKKFVAPSADEWQSFVRDQHRAPLGVAIRRPRPERSD